MPGSGRAGVLRDGRWWRRRRPGGHGARPPGRRRALCRRRRRAHRVTGRHHATQDPPSSTPRRHRDHAPRLLRAPRPWSITSNFSHRPAGGMWRLWFRHRFVAHSGPQKGTRGGSVRRATVCLAITAGLVLSGLAVQPAAADPPPTGWSDANNLPDGWQAQAGRVTVTVDGATGGRNISRLRRSTAVCRYTPYRTATRSSRSRGWVTRSSARGHRVRPGDPPAPGHRAAPGHRGQLLGTDVRRGAVARDDASRDALIDEFFANNNITFIGRATRCPCSRCPRPCSWTSPWST